MRVLRRGNATALREFPNFAKDYLAVRAHLPARIKRRYHPELGKLVLLVGAIADAEAHAVQVAVGGGRLNITRQIVRLGRRKDRGLRGAGEAGQYIRRIQLSFACFLIQPGIGTEVNRWKAMSAANLVEGGSKFTAK